MFPVWQVSISGAGEGQNSRRIAERCGSIVGVDMSPTLLRHARAAAPAIPYVLASAQDLPFADKAFDFAVASLSLMDMPRPELALRETARVLKPGGFLQFSITHPCFSTPIRHKVRDQSGRPYAVAIGGYFDGGVRVDEWLFQEAPASAKAGLRPFRMPVFYRTLSQWLNMLAEAGLRLERALEPYATPEVAEREPKVADTRIVAYFLHIRRRKPGATDI
jgi:SAM-dependent methyltransferase